MTATRSCGRPRKPAPSSPSEREIRSAEAAYRAASSAYEDARRRRAALLQRAAREGWSHSQLAELLEISRARIGQIAGEREQPSASSRALTSTSPRS